MGVDGTANLVMTIPPTPKGYSETLEWVTDVFRAHNGKETRAALLPVTAGPLHQVKLPLKALRAGERMKIENLLRYATKAYCYVPLWLSYTRLTSNATTVSVNCDTTSREFAAGNGLALFLRFATLEAEVRQIVSVSAGSMVIASALSAGVFLTGDLVIPLIKATPATSYAAIASQLDNTGRATLNFREFV